MSFKVSSNASSKEEDDENSHPLPYMGFQRSLSYPIGQRQYPAGSSENSYTWPHESSSNRAQSHLLPHSSQNSNSVRGGAGLQVYVHAPHTYNMGINQQNGTNSTVNYTDPIATGYGPISLPVPTIPCNSNPGYNTQQLYNADEHRIYPFKQNPPQVLPKFTVSRAQFPLDNATRHSERQMAELRRVSNAVASARFRQRRKLREQQLRSRYETLENTFRCLEVSKAELQKKIDEQRRIVNLEKQKHYELETTVQATLLHILNIRLIGSADFHLM